MFTTHFARRGNWTCLLNDHGDCFGGDYAGWGSNALAGMGLWGDPFGPGLPGLDPNGNSCYVDGMSADCGLARAAQGLGGIDLGKGDSLN